MNNQREETYHSKDLQKNLFLGSIKNYKKFCKILLNEAQQNEVCSMTKKLNNNCEPKSLSLKSKSGHETKLNDINDEFSISIFECLPDDDHEKAKVYEQWRCLGADSLVISKNSNKEKNDRDINGNLQNCKRAFLQEPNCTIEINDSLPRVGDIINPSVFLCPVFIICTFLILSAILIMCLFYIIVIYPRYFM